MASAGLNAFDDDDVENSYTANCFPIRSFFQQKEGAGHWLVAHRNAVEHKYRNRKPEEIKYATKSIMSECTRTDIPGCTLDAHLLLSLHCVDKPSDLCSVDISEQKLNLVKTEDLLDFENVAYVNASDNCLNMEPFGTFPSLRELELSLNGLCSVTLNAEDFPRLQVLDLSYNNLSGDGILSIGLIPCLKVLHLTGNQLQSLPPNMAVHGSSQRTKDNDLRYQYLQVLMLDDNKLSSDVFSSLANLKRLQHLNLQGNNISEVPEVLPKNLLQNGCFQHQEEPDKQHGIEHKINNHVTEGWDKKYMNAYSDITNHLHQHVKNSSETEAEDSEELSGAFALPLTELCFLNLADNKIVEEEALLPVALFPMLREIIIHSNPLTTQRSGDPPLLTYLLQERLGIKISRKKPSAVVKPPLIFSIDSKQKEKNVKRHCMSLGMSTKRPGCSSQPKNHEHGQQSTGAPDDAVESSDDTIQKGALFFVTQVTDLHYESEYHLLSDEKEVKEFEKNAIPGKFKGYELLLDANPDPDMLEPVGIQHSVRMLKQTLKTLLVYRDSKPNLDCRQKPYTDQKTEVVNPPSLRPKKQRGERVEDILIQMKETKAIRKIPLSSVLKGKGVSRQEYGEALALLREMKTKYKMVYMKAVEQATHIECKAISDQD